MATPGTVPITITPEAAEVVARLGMQAELDRLLERAVQTVPALKRIEVVLEPPYDTGAEDKITIEAIRGDPERLDDPTWYQWRDWIIGTSSSDVLWHFHLYMTHEPSDAG
jgi:hypothetical protein